MKKLFAAVLLAFFSVTAFAAVDLNTATVSELQAVSGIGAKKAQAIVDYRTEHGSFETVEDLSKVKGFGKKSVEKLAPELSVSKPKAAKKAATEEETAKEKK